MQNVTCKKDENGMKQAASCLVGEKKTAGATVRFLLPVFAMAGVTALAGWKTGWSSGVTFFAGGVAGIAAGIAYVREAIHFESLLREKAVETLGCCLLSIGVISSFMGVQMAYDATRINGKGVEASKALVVEAIRGGQDGDVKRTTTLTSSFSGKEYPLSASGRALCREGNKISIRMADGETTIHFLEPRPDRSTFWITKTPEEAGIDALTCRPK